jgi:ubiquinol-cytochrome c reductase cytochrome c subunit
MLPAPPDWYNMNNPSRIIIFVGAMLLNTVIARAADGQQLYIANCASCHGADGKGRTPAGKKLGAHDLTQSKLADAEIEKQIVVGTTDAKGNTRMPSFKAVLQPEEIAALVAYVAALRAGPGVSGK